MRVEWSPLAEEAWQCIATYIYEQFGTVALMDYSALTDSWMDVLAKNPFAAQEEELLKHREKSYRSISIHKLSKVILYVEDDVVYIADVWDTRRSSTSLIRRLR